MYKFIAEAALLPREHFTIGWGTKQGDPPCQCDIKETRRCVSTNQIQAEVKFHPAILGILLLQQATKWYEPGQIFFSTNHDRAALQI